MSRLHAGDFVEVKIPDGRTFRGVVAIEPRARAKAITIELAIRIHLRASLADCEIRKVEPRWIVTGLGPVERPGYYHVPGREDLVPARLG